MQVTARSLVIALVVIIVLVMTIGVVKWEKPTYGCYPDTSSRFEWKEKVEIFRWGSLHVYAYPLIKDCPVENRYEPEKAIKNVDV